MKKLYLIILMLLMNTAFATGPSSLSIRIIPLALNNEGQLLVKVRIEANPMGILAQQEVVYRLVIFDKYSIIFDEEFDRFVPSQDDFKKNNHILRAGDTDFQGIHMEMNHYLMKYIKEQFGFAKYKKITQKKRSITFDEFKMRYGLMDMRQITAGGYRSDARPGDSLNLEYEYPGFAVIRNTDDGQDNVTGDMFSIPVPFSGKKTSIIVPYEIFDIDGIIFQ